MFKYIFSLLFFCSLSLFSQEKTFGIGFNYGIGKQNAFIFNDDDYNYETRFHKLQFYFSLKSRKFNSELVLQPELNISKHQLLNKYYVAPNTINYLELQQEFTKEKTINEYAFNIGYLLRKNLLEKWSIYVMASIGPIYLDTKTERLPKGFAFNESLALGVSYKVSKFLFIDIRPSIRHVSTAELRQPNGGYNTSNIDLGMFIKL